MTKFITVLKCYNSWSIVVAAFVRGELEGFDTLQIFKKKADAEAEAAKWAVRRGHMLNLSRINPDDANGVYLND